MRMVRVCSGFLLAALVVAASGCSRATAASGTVNRNLITDVEIRQGDTGSAYDVIARLRPHYLRSRGPNSLLLKQQAYPTVFLDDIEYGAISTLRTIPASTVGAIRYLEGPESATRFGSRHVAGIIQVFTIPR